MIAIRPQYHPFFLQILNLLKISSLIIKQLQDAKKLRYFHPFIFWMKISQGNRGCKNHFVSKQAFFVTLWNLSVCFLKNILLFSLTAVALTAEHLAVVFRCATSVTPWGDVVTFHEFDVKLLATNRTLVGLALPCCNLDVVGEGSQVKVMLVTS